MKRSPSIGRRDAINAVSDSVVLGVACLVTFLLVDRLLSNVWFISRDDDLLGAMWAVIATIFVFRDSYQQSLAAAASRMAGTGVSFVFCLVYLIFLPFHIWAIAVLVGISALTVTLLGRPGDAVTAAITTAVVLVVAAVSPNDAWRQPVLRFLDTLVGVVIGLGAAWLGLRVVRGRLGAD